VKNSDVIGMWVDHAGRSFVVHKVETWPRQGRVAVGRKEWDHGWTPWSCHVSILKRFYEKEE
jgi:hypothetical protein